MRRLAAALFALMFGTVSASLPAAASSPFIAMRFVDHHQYVVSCAAHYECDVQLEAGERVNDGFNAYISSWDPHIGYTGAKTLTPHLVLRPAHANLRTNIILTTTKRTYYLLAVSTSSDSPTYYSFTYPDQTYHDSSRFALATQAALRSQPVVIAPAPTPTPADVADLATICFDFDYRYAVDRSVQSDHAPGARPSAAALPPGDVPREVCSDGAHTYIDFPHQREVPADLPIALGVTAEGDTLINYTYHAGLNRYTIDGVYESFVMELGSQASPLRLRIYHGSRGNPPAARGIATPTPIVTPAASGPSPAPATAVAPALGSKS